jgi:hypothetical protein
MFAPHNFSRCHFLIVIKIFYLVSFLEELIIDISYIVMLGKSGILLEPLSLIAHQ